MLDNENEKLFENSGVLSKTELKVRYETYIQSYISDCLIEAKTLVEMCKKQVFSSIENHISNLIDTLNKIEKTGVKTKTLLPSIKSLVENQIKLKLNVEELVNSLNNLNTFKKLEDKAKYCKDVININMLKVREIYDAIEPELSENCKPFPNYDDLLF